MEKIVAGSEIVIVILCLIIVGSISIIRSNSEEKGKIVILAMLHFIVYCLQQYSYGFIQWTIRLNKYDRYPYKNPFCILVIIYCIISFIIIGTYYIKYGKNKYGIAKTFLFLFAIHILAILLVMLFSPFNGWF